MKINKYICGFCRNNGKTFISSRKGLRKYLADKHIRASALRAIWIQSDDTTVGHYKHQDWWIVEEFTNEPRK
jgi:hypothetical protein